MNRLLQFRDLETVKLPDRPVHLAIGMFDGVHLGHVAVIEAAVQSARETGGLAAVLTFWPHPSALFRPRNPTRLLMLPSAKVRVLERLDVEVLITQTFDREFSQIAAEEFLSHVCRWLPRLTAVYVGANWRFGRGRLGNVGLLENQAGRLGISVFSAPRISFDGEPISSTRIRELLEKGAVERANALLGYAYFAEGAIVAGKGLGRKIGFPTLNLDWMPDLQPRFGVYAVRVIGERQSGERVGVANYGIRPTVENTNQPRLEVHVLGESSEKVGDRITVEWRHFIRPEMKFAGVSELKTQITRDREAASRWFAQQP